MLLVAPVDLLTYYSLTCWLVDSLTFKKNRCELGFNGFNWCKIPSLTGGGGMMWQRPNLWWGFGSCCGDSFIYLIPSTQSVNYERGCIFLLRFLLIMA